MEGGDQFFGCYYFISMAVFRTVIIVVPQYLPLVQLYVIVISIKRGCTKMKGDDLKREI